MDSGISALRNLLFFVMALVIIAILSNFWVASQVDKNSQELASLRLLMQKQMMGTALTQAEELQKRMDALNQSAAGIDARAAAPEAVGTKGRAGSQALSLFPPLSADL
ncbi:MAG: hypothetical protein LAO07_14830 [Acidobacteriia bacterium]|nr:hypothetical protein [Terriglobia bacterium]